MIKRFIISGLIFTTLILTVSFAVIAHEEIDGRYFTLKDSKGKIICRTARSVAIGDRYLDSKDQLYQVVQTKDFICLVKPVKQNGANSGVFAQLKTAISDIWQNYRFRAEVKAKGPICIYHTHDDESYQPSEGVSSKKTNGGIVDVGEAIAKKCEQFGIPVVHSKNTHFPHDAMAYDRSRRTAAQLLKRQPPVMLDVHRDAVPAEEYATMVDNQPATKIQLVVGRQNPNFKANNDYAWRVKKAVDKKYPGLVKGIFYGKGKYNQDLGPRAMLLECGSNTNRKEAAIRGAEYFMAASRDVLYGAAGNWTTNRGSWRSAFWIVAAVLGVVGIFLLLNKKGLSSISREFGGKGGPENDQDEG